MNTPLDQRPEAVILREQVHTAEAIAEALSKELGEINKALNFLASRGTTTITHSGGYYTLSTDGKHCCGTNLRAILLEVANE